LLPIQNPLTNPLFDFYYESLASGELIALTCAAYELEFGGADALIHEVCISLHAFL
jgi:hypothetical protein